MTFSSVKEFQVVQKKTDEIIIKIVLNKKNEFTKINSEELKKIITKKSGKINIKIEIVDKIERTNIGKWKFIVNELGRNGLCES